MSDLALYRKYRPKKFSEVVGQSHVVDVLSSAIKNDKIVHAYLFAGSRGIGKTSIARIFANEIGTSPEDIFEIDAASNRGIDEIRELRDAVHTLPLRSNYKVYIIDEVHMLTTPAFNALLKTLEEPPSHVIFILATTETHKLPETIVSRCQVFNFKKPSEIELSKTLDSITKKEGYKIDKSALQLLAALGEGSFRDAIGNLQKVMEVSKDKDISIEEAEKITGAPNHKLVSEIIRSILDLNTEGSLSILSNLSKKGIEAKIILKLLMSKIRIVMFLAFAPKLKDKISEEISKDELEDLESINEKYESKLYPILLRELLDAYSKIDRSYIKDLPIELAIINFIESTK